MRFTKKWKYKEGCPTIIAFSEATTEAEAELLTMLHNEKMGRICVFHLTYGDNIERGYCIYRKNKKRKKIIGDNVVRYP